MGKLEQEKTVWRPAGVAEVYDLRAWTLTSGMNVATRTSSSGVRTPKPC